MRLRLVNTSLIVLLLLVLPGMVWFQSTGNLLVELRPGSMPGQVPYLLSKLMGLYVVIFLWLQVMYGLTRDDRLFAFLPAWNKKRHQLMGITTFVTIVLHYALFVAAVSIRKGTFAYDLLVPDFSDYYHTMLSLGWLALVMIIAVIFARVARNYIEINMIWLHRLAIPALFLALTHGLMIGSEASMDALIYLYLSLGVTAALIVLRRFMIFFSGKSVSFTPDISG